MARNYFIGIGGTGARVAEALIHLCAAGHGPKDFFFFIVDPDHGNGNLGRTRKLVDAYHSARAAVGHRDIGGFFGTEIHTPPEKDKLVWHIFDRQNVNLDSYLELDNMRNNPEKAALAMLAEVLFTDQELTTDLNEGFRGHPAIGATVMSVRDDKHDPWKSFWKDVAQATTAGEAKVFLAGSIFGGTGAAGVPTFGAKEVLKFFKDARLDDSTSRVTLGGCLVLPYFSFNTEKSPSEESKMHVTWQDFPLATRAALDYYFLRKDLQFDDLYLLGDSLGQEVGEFGAGASKQENRPHYVELVAALAALDFWERGGRSGVTDEEGKSFLTAGRDSDVLSFGDLPVTRLAGEAIVAEQRRLKFNTVAMVVFSYALGAYGLEVLRHGKETKKEEDTWYKEMFGKAKRGNAQDVDPRSDKQRSKVEAAELFGEKFLQWLYGMSSGDDNVQLTRVATILRGATWDAVTPKPWKSDETAIGRVLAEGGTGKFQTFINILDPVAQAFKGQEEAGPRMLRVFAQAAKQFTAEVLGVPSVQEVR